MSSRTDICRARPLLGTFAEIRARGEKSTALHRAIEAGFSAIEQVHRLMSLHEAESELSILNRSAHLAAVRVHPWTYEVLKTALHLSERTKGTFDITVGALLTEWGYYPKQSEVGSLEASWTAIELLPDCEVKFHHPLTIDLGGIAKGFAVDKAIEALVSNGISSGYVNAGGEIRVIGRERLHLRDGSGSIVSFIELSNDAVATSSPAVSRRPMISRQTAPSTDVSALVDGRSRRPSLDTATMSVRAPSCMIADGLTKVLFGYLPSVSEILAEFGACAYRYSGGELSVLSPELS